jgi:hypothetical protein
LVIEVNDEVLVFAPLPEFKMTHLTKLKKHQNTKHGSEMEEDDFVDQLLAEVELEN